VEARKGTLDRSVYASKKDLISTSISCHMDVEMVLCFTANHEQNSPIIDESLIPSILIPSPIDSSDSLQGTNTDFIWGKAYHRPKPFV